MKTSRSLLLILTLVLAGLSNAYAGILYTVRGSDDRLFSIDTNTFSIANIGALGVPFSFGGMSYDANSDTLYMIGGRSNTPSLYTVDRTTGAASLVGSHGIVDLFGLTFDSLNGDLYGSQFGFTNGLYSLNTSTGAATLIGNTGIRLGGLAYDAARDMLVGMLDGLGDLYAINRSTATSSLLLNGTFVNNSGLAYDNDQDLFWDLDYNGNLRSYDPTSGYTQVLQTNFGTAQWDGLAYLSSPAAVPEPATLALFGIGLAGLGFARKKKKSV